MSNVSQKKPTALPSRTRKVCQICPTRSPYCSPPIQSPSLIGWIAISHLDDLMGIPSHYFPQYRNSFWRAYLEFYQASFSFLPVLERVYIRGQSSTASCSHGMLVLIPRLLRGELSNAPFRASPRIEKATPSPNAHNSL